MSRYRRNWIFVLCLFFLIVLVAVDRSVHQKYKPADLHSQQIKANDIEKYNGRTFKVVNIVDGDTIDIDIPDGKFNHTRIRLLGIDTPETKHSDTGPMYFGSQASDFVRQQVLDKTVCVYLDSINKTRGKYGRLLAYVQLPDTTFLNEILLKKGLAYADLRFKHQFLNSYPQLENIARNNKIGLWENVTRDQLPSWLQREKPNLLKKPN